MQETHGATATSNSLDRLLVPTDAEGRHRGESESHLDFFDVAAGTTPDADLAEARFSVAATAASAPPVDPNSKPESYRTTVPSHGQPDERLSTGRRPTALASGSTRGSWKNWRRSCFTFAKSAWTLMSRQPRHPGTGGVLAKETEEEREALPGYG